MLYMHLGILYNTKICSNPLAPGEKSRPNLSLEKHKGLSFLTEGLWLVAQKPGILLQ